MQLKKVHVATVLILAGLAGCAPKVTPIGPGNAFQPTEKERRLWAMSSEHTRDFENGGMLYEDNALDEYVNGVLVRLLGGSRDEYSPLTARARIIDSPVFNAFAWPNGDILIHTGTLGRLRNEAQLAMLLGHEITHATHRHGLCYNEKAYAASGALAYISVLSAVGGGNVHSITSRMGTLITMAAINGYGRENEEESDRVGLLLMARAGYDPQEGARMFERVLAAIEDADRGWSFFYSSHPKMNDRVRSCRKWAAEMPSAESSGAQELGSERYLGAVLPLIHDEIERHIVQGRFDLAEQSVGEVLQVLNDDAICYALRGELLRARSKGSDLGNAERAYLEALKIDGELPLAHRGLGLLLLKQGRELEALSHFRQYLTHAGDAADAAYIRQTVQNLEAGKGNSE